MLLNWVIGMDKNFIFYIKGGGTFSRFLQCAIQPLAAIDFDNVYLTASQLDWDYDVVSRPENSWITESINLQIHQLKNYGVQNPYDKIFNYFLVQHFDQTYKIGNLPISKMYTKENPIEKSLYFYRYKEIISKIQIKNSLISRAIELFRTRDIDKILAVHLRIKDIGGHNYDQVLFSNYVQAIDRELKNFSYDNIFVAADNLQSLIKLKEIYGNLIIHNDVERSDTDNDDYARWEFENYFKKKYWESSIIDCISLSKCKNLICRTSNFSNAAIVYGNYSEIIRL